MDLVKLRMSASDKSETSSYNYDGNVVSRTSDRGISAASSAITSSVPIPTEATSTSSGSALMSPDAILRWAQYATHTVSDISRGYGSTWSSTLLNGQRDNSGAIRSCTDSRSPVEVKVYGGSSAYSQKDPISMLPHSRPHQPLIPFDMYTYGVYEGQCRERKRSDRFNYHRIQTQLQHRPYQLPYQQKQKYSGGGMPSGTPSVIPSSINHSRIQPNSSPLSGKLNHSPSSLSVSSYYLPSSNSPEWEHRAFKASPSSTKSSPSKLASPTSPCGYSAGQWRGFLHDHSCCNHPTSYRSGSSTYMSNHRPSASQTLPNNIQEFIAMQREKYAKTLYSLRYALKSDVFMGYGKNNERFELYTEDRCISPLGLLEINESLDWSEERHLIHVDSKEPTAEPIDRDVVFSAIQLMSQALTY